MRRRSGRFWSVFLAAGSLVALAVSLGSAITHSSALAAAAPLRSITIGEGGSENFSFSSLPPELALSAAPGGRLVLRPQVLWMLDGSSPGYAGRFPPDPRSVQRLSNGNTLLADRVNCLVGEFRPNGTLAWSYTKADDPKLVWPFAAQRLANGNTLITDRRGTRVFEVTPAKHLVWQYGSTAEWGTGVDRLADPFSATRLPNGNTLICDNKEANRVIEVRTSDYDPAKPNNGYTPASIVWRYGQDGVDGVAAGQLRSPRSAQRLGNGDTLICDAWANRVIQVTPSGDIVWQYGQTDVTNTGDPVDDLLKDCNFALRLATGNTVICDTGNSRVIEVDDQGHLVRQRGNGPLDEAAAQLREPRSLDVTADGRLIIADTGGARVAELGMPASATATSKTTECGLHFTKSFVSLDWTGEGNGRVSIAYRIDSGPWHSAGSSGYFTFPSGTRGWDLTYRATLQTADHNSGPELASLTIAYRRYEASSGGNNGDGSSGGTGSGGGGSGGGTGSGGSSGSDGGAGSGSGSGSGDGSSTGHHGKTSPSGGAVNSTTTEGIFVAPRAEVVTGTVVQEPNGTVTGTVLKSGGGTRGGGGRSSGGPAERISAAAVTSATVLGLSLLAAPAAFVDRRRRRLSAHDHSLDSA